MSCLPLSWSTIFHKCKKGLVALWVHVLAVTTVLSTNPKSYTITKAFYSVQTTSKDWERDHHHGCVLSIKEKLTHYCRWSTSYLGRAFFAHFITAYSVAKPPIRQVQPSGSGAGYRLGPPTSLFKPIEVRRRRGHMQHRLADLRLWVLVGTGLWNRGLLSAENAAEYDHWWYNRTS